MGWTSGYLYGFIFVNLTISHHILVQTALRFTLLNTSRQRRNYIYIEDVVVLEDSLRLNPFPIRRRAGDLASDVMHYISKPPNSILVPQR